MANEPYPAAVGNRETSGPAAGFIIFAATMMILVRTWARAVAITLAGLSVVANFLFIPYYPFWSITAIVIDVFVIWAVAAHGRELRYTAG